MTINDVTTSYNKTTKYDYDLSNQLASVAISTPEADGTTGDISYKKEVTTNAYNASGQRIARIVGDWVDSDNDDVYDNGELQNGNTSKYYYSGSEVLFTTDEDNFLLTENILDRDGSIVVSMRFEDRDPSSPDPYKDRFFFYHYDKRGSTTAIIKPDGSLITGYSYDEFGNLEQTGATDFLNDVTFTGSVSDTSTGLQYMNARFYQPSTGRFLTQDTYSGNAYDPWTQHLYAYCGNNPTNMIDPTGHNPIALVAKIISAAVAALAGGTIIGNTDAAPKYGKTVGKFLGGLLGNPVKDTINRINGIGLAFNLIGAWASGEAAEAQANANASSCL